MFYQLYFVASKITIYFLNVTSSERHIHNMDYAHLKEGQLGVSCLCLLYIHQILCMQLLIIWNLLPYQQNWS